jgi:hypothetical protein
MQHLDIQGQELSGGLLRNYGVLKRGLDMRVLRKMSGPNRENNTRLVKTA